MKRVLAGRYRVEELLDRGRQGTVWRGHDSKLDRPVAIKLLAFGGLADPEAWERFERAADTAGRLKHPNIVDVYDVGVDGGDRFLVMELLEGSSVAAMLTEGRLSVERVVAIATQICDGLSAAHAAGVIHGDVKPSNLIVTPAGVVKICDFGIAALYDAMGQATRTGTSQVGDTSRYMPPEQAAGDRIDARTDLYQLGCTIYTMLTGARPFAGGSPLHVLSQHLTRPPTPVRTHRHDVPPGLDSLVSQLLAKNPADRPGDAGVVNAGLAAVFADPGAAVAATRVARPERTVVSPARAIVASPVITPDVDDAMADPTPAPYRDDFDESAPANGRGRRLGSAAVAAVVGIPVLLAVTATALLTAGGSGSPSAQPPAPPPVTTGSAPVVASSPGAVGLTQAAQTPAAPSPAALPGVTAAPGGTAGPAGPAGTVAAGGPASQGAIGPTSATASPAVLPPDLTAAIVAMRAAIEGQVDAGQLNSTSGADLQGKVDQIAREAAEGDWTAARYYAAKVREKLGKLLDDGMLTSAGYAVLIARVDLIDEALS